MRKRTVISYKTYMKDIKELQNTFEKTRREFESYIQKQENLLEDARNTNDKLNTNIKELLNYRDELELSYNKITNKFKVTFIGLTISLMLNIVLLIRYLF